MAIKAIQTRYAGCHFRSRLEARWAVFFDALGIEWQYEPQGFEVSSGRYLPDFYLPNVTGNVGLMQMAGPNGTMFRADVLGGRWLEVKGAPGRIGHDEWQRMQDFANEIAMPARDRYTIVFSIPDPRDFKGFIGPVPTWVGPLPGGVMPASEQTVDNCSPGCIRLGFVSGLWVPGGTEDQISHALTKARSARFEHGENG